MSIMTQVARRGLVIPIVLILVSGGAIAGGALVFNYLESTNVVKDEVRSVHLEFVNVDYGLPNWTVNGELTTGKEYCFGVKLTSNTTTSVWLTILFNEPQPRMINTTDITLWYFNTTASNWTEVPLFDFEGVALYRYVGPNGPSPDNPKFDLEPGSTTQIDFKIRYNVPKTVTLVVGLSES